MKERINGAEQDLTDDAAESEIAVIGGVQYMFGKVGIHARVQSGLTKLDKQTVAVQTTLTSSYIGLTIKF